MNRGRREAPGLGGSSAARRTPASMVVTAGEEGDPAPFPADSGNGVAPGVMHVGLKKVHVELFCVFILRGQSGPKENLVKYKLKYKVIFGRKHLYE